MTRILTGNRPRYSRKCLERWPVTSSPISCMTRTVERVKPFGGRARAIGVEMVGRFLSQEHFRHLTPSGIAGAKKQNRGVPPSLRLLIRVVLVPPDRANSCFSSGPEEKFAEDQQQTRHNRRRKR